MTDSIQSSITPVNIEEELKSSYLDYAMSVIVGRALPDVRDGLKPVHRRVLFSMDREGNTANKKYVKSARVVGDVIGKYHPHGDSAVYDTIVRMAQPFSLRYMLVDGQGNFGSIDGDAPAAMRYTEVRMQKITQALLTDLDKETVNFSPNYDGELMIPDVLPTRIPALLANGSSGIAVGMATNIPPHNLNEVLNGCLAYIDNNEITIDELMQHIPGPDFPTAALINGRKGIEEAYRTGRGKVYVRARATVESNEKGREQIIVSELPYQVNKAKLVEKIAELIREKKIEGISNITDLSNKEGIRIEIDIKRDAVGEVVLNHLYSLTQMQVTFGINMVALDHGQPRLFNLKEIIESFVLHRREVVTRRSIFELRKARERTHILEGLAVARSNIDEMIAIIRNSKNREEAATAISSRSWTLHSDIINLLDVSARPDDLEENLGIQGEQYYLSPAQVNAILELRLHRLTGIAFEEVVKEYEELLVKTNIQKASLEGELKLIVEKARQAVSDYKRCKEASENYEKLHNQITIMNLTNQSLIKFKEQRIKNSIPELTDIASEILARFTDNKFTQLILTDKFETFVITENNVKRPVSQLSGGELSAAAIALRLAIALFLNNGQQHLLILDEVLTAMSSDRSQLILETITSLTNAQIILIAHNDGINSFADKVVHL